MRGGGEGEFSEPVVRPPQFNGVEPRLFLKCQKLLEDTSDEAGFIRRCARGSDDIVCTWLGGS